MENRPLVALEDVEPGSEVARVPQGGFDTEGRGDVGACDFGNELLACIGLVAEAFSEGLVEAACVAGPVPGLVKERPSVVERVGKVGRNGQADEVADAVVEGAVPVMANVDAGGADEMHRVGAELVVAGGGGFVCVFGRQSAALRDVEHRVAAQHRDGVRLVAVERRALELLLRDVALGVAMVSPCSPLRMRPPSCFA